MKFIPVTFVRLYIMENEKLLNPVLKYLHDDHIRGVSVFRAISGYGSTGMHTSSLLDLSLNLPLAVEFFDAPVKIEKVLEDLHHLVKPEHIVCWSAQANDEVDAREK